MLRRLSGTTHRVLTGVCVLCKNQMESFVAETAVEFYPLTDEEILQYIRTGEPMDKAGAYGIQGVGSLFVRRIEGDYYNVVGLPVAKTARLLFQMGVTHSLIAKSTNE